MIWFKKILALTLAATIVVTGCAQKAPVTSSTPNAADNKAELALEYTNTFKVLYLKDDCRLITDSLGREIICVPEGKEVPEEYKDKIVLKGNINKVGAFQIPIATAISAAGAIDKISLVTYPEDKWTIPEIKTGLQKGSILYVGGEAEPDYEMIKANKPDIIFMNGDAHNRATAGAKFDELNIVWISVASHLEEHPLGRVEWQKFIAAFLGTEKASDASFKVQKDAYEALVASTKNKAHPKVGQFYIMGDSIYVKNGGSYVAKMITAAGGDYAFKSIGADIGGNTKLTPEEFFALASQADILFYDNASATKFQTLSALVENRDYMKNIPAIKAGKIWGMKPGYNQYIDRLGEITVALSTAIYDDVKAPTENNYYKPLVD